MVENIFLNIMTLTNTKSSQENRTKARTATTHTSTNSSHDHRTKDRTTTTHTSTNSSHAQSSLSQTQKTRTATTPISTNSSHNHHSDKHKELARPPLPQAKKNHTTSTTTKHKKFVRSPLPQTQQQSNQGQSPPPQRQHRRLHRHRGVEGTHRRFDTGAVRALQAGPG